jgi:hypothetical protein
MKNKSKDIDEEISLKIGDAAMELHDALMPIIKEADNCTTVLVLSVILSSIIDASTNTYHKDVNDFLERLSNLAYDAHYNHLLEEKNSTKH